MNELTRMLGDDRRAELLRDAEASRQMALALRVGNTGRARLRQRIGWALVWAGQLLAGSEAVQPANGH